VTAEAGFGEHSLGAAKAWRELAGGAAATRRNAALARRSLQAAHRIYAAHYGRTDSRTQKVAKLLKEARAGGSADDGGAGDDGDDHGQDLADAVHEDNHN
jgi:hypothetical protein